MSSQLQMCKRRQVKGHKVNAVHTSRSMSRAIKILNSVADVGFTRSPGDQKKRSELIHGLLQNKYDRAKEASSLGGLA